MLPWGSFAEDGILRKPLGENYFFSVDWKEKRREAKQQASAARDSPAAGAEK